MTFPIDVYIGAGSNIEPEKNLHLACVELRKTFGRLDTSPVYETAAVGFEGADFWNMVMRIATVQPLADIIDELERIHDLSGRAGRSERFVSRTLDLDVLLYGALCAEGSALQLPRDDITRYAFVLAPMADLAPDLVHPVKKKTMRQLWASFSDGGQPIRRVPDALE